MLTTPSIMLVNNIFDASNSITINFLAVGGSQVSANEVQVYKNSDNTLIYDNTTSQQYFLLNHIIPASTLTNGITYKIKIRSFDFSNNTSNWSDWVIIQCYSSIVLDITNVPNNSVYNNQQLVPTGTFTQSEGDTLKNYEYYLYDQNMNLLFQTGLIYDNLLTYQSFVLENNTTYYIKLLVNSQAGATAQITRKFSTEYIAPTFSNLLTLTNDKENAKVDVNIIAIRTVGHIKSGTVTSDGEYVDCTNGVVSFDDSGTHGLNFKYNNGNWQMQLWLKGLVDQYAPVNGVLEGTLITPIFGDNGVMCKLEYYNGMFHYYKFITVNNQYSLISHYVSNVINATSDDVVYLFVNCQNDRIGMSTQIIN